MRNRCRRSDRAYRPRPGWRAARRGSGRARGAARRTASGEDAQGRAGVQLLVIHGELEDDPHQRQGAIGGHAAALAHLLDQAQQVGAPDIRDAARAPPRLPGAVRP